MIVHPNKILPINTPTVLTFFLMWEIIVGKKYNIISKNDAIKQVINI